MKATLRIGIIASLIALFTITLLSHEKTIDAHPRPASQDPVLPTSCPTTCLDGRIPITRIGAVINNSGSYVLTRSLQAPNGFQQPGITIAVSNVTIDLNGFSLVGPDQTNLGGIFIESGVSAVQIRNGFVARWGGNGIDGFDANGLVIEGIVATDNNNRGIAAGKGSSIARCTAIRNDNDGISVFPGSMIKDCLARDNSDGGIVCTGASGNESSYVVDCIASKNARGFLINGVKARFERCHATENGKGFDSQNALTARTRCTAQDNTSENFSGSFASDLCTTFDY